MDYIYIVEAPTRIYLNASFRVVVELDPVRARDYYDIVFEISGRGMSFVEDSPSADFAYQTVRRLEHDPGRFIQESVFELMVTSDGSRDHFPVRAFLSAYSNNSDLVDCKIQIHGTYA